MLQKAMPIIHLFFCYSHADQALRDELETHLAMLKRSRQIKSWHDHMISPGNTWKREIEHQLNTAQIILLLISPDFLASYSCYEEEMQHALLRHDIGDAHVIPILLRHADWQDAPFNTLQMLPTNIQPLSDWSDRDAFFINVVQGIRKIIDEVVTKQETDIRNNDPEPMGATKTLPSPGKNQLSSTEKYKIHANTIHVSSLGDNFGTIHINHPIHNPQGNENKNG